MYCVCLSTFLLVLKEQNNAFVVYKLLQSITKVFIHDIWLQISNVCKIFCESKSKSPNEFALKAGIEYRIFVIKTRESY